MSGVMINDDAALELISNAAKERLKYLMDQVKLVALHRIDISMKVPLNGISFLRCKENRNHLE